MSDKMKLTVDTGSILIDIEDEKGNKIGEFDFIPTDSNILHRYESVVEFLNSVKIEENLSDEEKIQQTQKLSEEVKKQINYLIGGNASETIFEVCGPFTVIANGDLFFENVLEGIGNLIENVFNQRIKKKINKIKNANAQYHK